MLTPRLSRSSQTNSTYGGSRGIFAGAQREAADDVTLIGLLASSGHLAFLSLAETMAMNWKGQLSHGTLLNCSRKRKPVEASS